MTRREILLNFLFCYSSTNEIVACMMFFYHVTINNTIVISQLKIIIKNRHLGTDFLENRTEFQLHNIADHALFNYVILISEITMMVNSFAHLKNKIQL